MLILRVSAAREELMVPIIENLTPLPSSPLDSHLFLRRAGECREPIILFVHDLPDQLGLYAGRRQCAAGSGSVLEKGSVLMPRGHIIFRAAPLP
jgi:hypothetical protein